MAIFAIGDVQGCYREFRRLLDLVRFDDARDRLWLVGDIVNRGPDSLSVLRFVRDLGDAVIMVLGNHDLHLLMVAEGCARLHRNDTLQEVLAAPDRDELLHWLRHQPLLHVENDHVLVHAGLLPSWSVSQAAAHARSVEAVLRGDGFHALCAHMYGDAPDRWDERLTGYARLRVIINAMTRMRVCTPDGRMEFAHKGTLEDIPDGYLPWFEVPGRVSRGATVVFGHWSALGLRVAADLIALDTGCLWGGSLTAVRLEDRRIFQVPCAAAAGTGLRR
ncbi:symmetrical bis(5'-nucleosyl)-tetraphosphatase [Nitrosovibrio sp. Nv17]|jgi:bis(5'-nucleosyl)-tetraphosphatase (symmetrical)|uniref:symmetrical bis(5'-nucleosyl)-tetraphosphatase n=1 Tax=Nitrosovibrio sp. Nv17 TaxID=1855339 RepID=UPI0009086ADA|nr:symmetrical bis(5'-nucleosyl)-tetraphosphatase [Nitrosovibrio sp. Nv17]SFW33148.1 Bis(5'nucleosyl)-tetraphosphatase, ApaH [Nitrosovibrio sp. Nv17]